MHVKAKAKQSAEFFQLLVRLLEYVNRSATALPNAEALLNNEIQWLKKTRVSTRQRSCFFVAANWSNVGSRQLAGGEGEATGTSFVEIASHRSVLRHQWWVWMPSASYFASRIWLKEKKGKRRAFVLHGICRVLVNFMREIRFKRELNHLACD